MALVALSILVLVAIRGIGSVQLLTDNGHPPVPGCFTDWAEGPLVVDASAGTAIIDSDMNATVPVPVVWRQGFTARRNGSEVQVLDPTGTVVAETGHSYRIDGGYALGGFWACDKVTPQ